MGLSHDDNYKSLAYAIVESAINDYYKARFFLDTIEERDFKAKEGDTYKETLTKKKTPKLKTVGECELFFKSTWFDTLIGDIVDSRKAFKGLVDTYNAKVYPQMYEEFWPAEMRKFYRNFAKIMKRIQEGDYDKMVPGDDVVGI